MNDADKRIIECEACGKRRLWVSPFVIPNNFCWDCEEKLANIAKDDATERKGTA